MRPLGLKAIMNTDEKQLWTLAEWEAAATRAGLARRTRFLDSADYTQRQKRAAQRVLDILDKADGRQEDAYQSHRKHKRHWFRGVVTVCIPHAALGLNTADTFRVWARSISQGGLSFVYPYKIEETKIVVGITIPQGGKSWFFGEIVRVREIRDEGFWEYGVAFRDRYGP